MVTQYEIEQALEDAQLNIDEAIKNLRFVARQDKRLAPAMQNIIQSLSSISNATHNGNLPSLADASVIYDKSEIFADRVSIR